MCAALGALGAAVATTASGRVSALPEAPHGADHVVDIRPWLAETQAQWGDAFAERARWAMAAQAKARAQTGKPYGLRSLARQQGGAYEELIDDFEGQLIDTQKWFWNLDSDFPPTRFGEYFWALSQCTSKPRKAGDVQSFWAVGGGRDGSKLKCGDPYPSGAASEAALLLDLRYWDPNETQQLDLSYDYWLNTRLGVENGIVQDGLFVVLCIPEGGEPCRRQVVLNAQFGQSTDWFDHPAMVNLLNACNYYEPSDCYSLAGREIIIKFLFKTQRPVTGMQPPTTYANGAFIDNVMLVADREKGPMITPLPTWTPVPTFAVTLPPEMSPTTTPTLDIGTEEPTETAGPSPTDGPTDTPEPPTDTPVASNTPRATDTPDTPVATDTPSPTNTRRPTPTATRTPQPPKVFLPIGYSNRAPTP